MKLKGGGRGQRRNTIKLRHKLTGKRKHWHRAAQPPPGNVSTHVEHLMHFVCGEVCDFMERSSSSESFISVKLYCLTVAVGLFHCGFIPRCFCSKWKTLWSSCHLTFQISIGNCLTSPEIWFLQIPSGKSLCCNPDSLHELTFWNKQQQLSF